jgi:hypothetical protein
MSHEYPRALYLGGDTKAAFKLVADADDEKTATGDGFYRAGKGPKKADTAKTEPMPPGDPFPGDEPAPPLPKRKPGRPKKAT